MTEAQLDAIEKAVGFPLPDAYRRVAVASPFRPIGRDRIDWFFDDPEAVIAETLSPQPDSEQDLPRLPIGCLAIGFSPCGDTYVLDTRAEGLPVACLSHETHEIGPDYPSFDAFVSEWLDAPDRIQAELDATAAVAAAEARARNRRAGKIILLGSLPFLAFLILIGIIAWING